MKLQDPSSRRLYYIILENPGFFNGGDREVYNTLNNALFRFGLISSESLSYLCLVLSNISPTQDYDSSGWAAERIVSPTHSVYDKDF